MASSGDLRSLLGPATFSQIPTNAQVVLQQAWTSHTDTLKTNLEKVKVDAEQKIAELTSNNNELSSKLAVYTEETEKGQTALQMYREQEIVLVYMVWSGNLLTFPVMTNEPSASLERNTNE